MNTTTDFSSTTPGSNSVENAIKRTATAAHNTVDRMAEAATSAQTRVQAATSHLGDDVNKFVSSRPVQCLAGAIAFGFLLGRLMR